MGSLLDAFKLRKSLIDLDRYSKTNGDDPLFCLFYKSTGKLLKYLHVKLQVHPSASFDWDETWWYLICRTRIQCRIHSIPLDEEKLTEEATITLGRRGKLRYNLEDRFKEYASPPGPRDYTYDIPVEQALDSTKRFLHYAVIELAKTSAEGRKANLSEMFLNKSQQELLNTLASSMEQRIPESLMMLIAAKTEILATKLSRKIAKLKPA
jgi:hypothetical protein